MSITQPSSPLTKPKHYNLEILLFSSIRILVHAMMRMVYPFLAVFGRGLGVDLTTISLAVTIRNLAAILVPFIASIFDKRSRRSGMLTGMGLFIAGCAVVTFWPTFVVFIIALSLTFIGMHVFVASMQAYQSDTIPLPIRGQAIVITSTGWALSSVIAVPLIGFLIGRFGWLAPFPAMGILGVISIFFLLWLVPRGRKSIQDQSQKIQHGILQVFTSRTAIAGVLMILFFCAAHEVVNLVFGVWMEDNYGLSINALGVASTVIGLAELLSVAIVSWLIAKLGSKRTVAIGLVFSAITALTLPWLGGFGLWGAEAGLFLFNLAFQMPFIAYAPLLTEVLPLARASLLGATLASVGVGRMLGALAAPYLFARGFQFNALAAMVLFLISLFTLTKVKTHLEQAVPVG
ncbi:MAG: MFS transporter [Anaerolineaceae bacterium]|jgi:predicted MFS family arabinose efflux permease|nr:MFS transporter [Anaerolineaceae bacterium]